MNKKFLSFIFVLSFIFLSIFINKVDAANVVLFPKEINQTGVTLRATDLLPSTFYTFYITEKGKTTPLNNANIYSEPDGTAEASFQNLLPGSNYQASIELQGEPEKTLSSFTFKTYSGTSISISAKNITDTTATLFTQGVLNDKTYHFILFDDINTLENPIYIQNVDRTTENSIETTFKMLTPNHHYYVAIDYYLNINKLASVIGFNTLTTTAASQVNQSATPAPKESIYKGGIVPECNTGEVNKETGQFSNPCDFKYFMDLLNSIIKFLLFAIATPMIALIVMYTGYLYLTAGGSAGQTEKAKHILFNVVVGYIIALAAWLIVNTIVTSLLPKNTDIDTFLSKEALVK